MSEKEELKKVSSWQVQQDDTFSGLQYKEDPQNNEPYTKEYEQCLGKEDDLFSELRYKEDHKSDVTLYIDEKENGSTELSSDNDTLPSPMFRSNSNIYTSTVIEPGILYGPIQGEIIDDISFSSRYSWLVNRDGCPNHVIHAGDIVTSNWLRDIKRTDSSTDCNMEMLQIEEDIYYKVTKEIEASQELVVFDANASEYKTNETSNPIKMFQCDVCQKEFKRNYALKEHYRTHTNERPYPCTVCGKRFSKLCSLKVHMRTHDGLRPYECKECGKTFSNNGNMRQHQRIHTGDKPFECEECGHRFAFSSNLREHIFTHTRNKVHKCNKCNKSFIKETQLRHHFETHLNEKILDAFSKRSVNGKMPDLEEYANEPVQPEVKDDVKYEYVCSLCGKQFMKQQSLTYHMKCHEEQKVYKCEFCSKEFTKSTALKIHVRIHTNDKPYVCTFCAKGFAHSSNLTLHIRTHTGDAPYQCKICEKRFKNSGGLRAHMRTHTGHAPYACSMCDVSFKDYKALKNHQKNHDQKAKSSQERININIDLEQYICDICGRALASNNSLKVHKRTHSGVKPYACTMCGRAFAHSSNMKVHMKSCQKHMENSGSGSLFIAENQDGGDEYLPSPEDG